MAALKRVSQTTFDEIVKENMDEFEMEPEEALTEAISQFQKQGVDLTNLDLTGGIGRQEILDAINQLKEQSSSTRTSEDAILSTISNLKQLCDKGFIFSQRNIMLMREDGGVNSLHLLIDENKPKKVVIAALDFLNELSSASVSIRDFFEPGGAHRVVSLFEKHSSITEEDSDLLLSALALSRTVMRTEDNKTAFIKEGLGTTIAQYFSQLPSPLPNSLPSYLSEFIEKLCACIRGLSVHDDVRKEMSSAYDNGKFFLKQGGVVEGLMHLASQYSFYPPLASAALSAAKALVTTNEAVQVLSLHGAVELVFDIINLSPTAEPSSQPSRSLNLMRSAVGLLRNLAADDQKKESFLFLGGMQALLYVMSIEPYSLDAPFVEHSLASLAMISLRSPGHSERMVKHGAVALIVKAMQTFQSRDTLQRQGCLSLRNVAGRCPDLRPIILEAGAEGALRAAGLLPTVVDEAYAALRDLNCEVQYVKVEQDGTVRPVYEQFGNIGGKLNFRPVFEETDDIEQTIADKARAPFSQSHCDDSDCEHDH